MAVAFVGLCGFIGVRVATGSDPALAAQVAARNEDRASSDGVGVLLDIAGTLLGDDGESSRGAPANPATGTSD